MSRLNRLFEEDIMLQESLSDADNLYDDNEDTIIGVLEDRDLIKEANEKVHLFENNIKEPDYELRSLIEELVETEEESLEEAEITDIYNDPDLDLEDCLLDDEDDDLGGML
jgi:hypothetical protein